MLTFPTLITGTITDLRISSVDGTAFLDNCAALVPYADGNHRIEIYDASGRILQGYLKAQGSAETYTDIIGGTDPALLNGDFTAGDTGWTKGANWTIEGTPYKGVATAAPNTSRLYRLMSSTANSLGKVTITCSDYTAGGVVAYSSVGGAPVILNGTGESIRYFTFLSTLYNVGATSIGSVSNTFKVSSIVAQRVLTPSTDGVTIVSAKGGGIYNFASKDASFTYNAASYRYVIYDTLKVSRPTRYMGVSTHNI